MKGNFRRATFGVVALLLSSVGVLTVSAATPTTAGAATLTVAQQAAVNAGFTPGTATYKCVVKVNKHFAAQYAANPTAANTSLAKAQQVHAAAAAGGAPATATTELGAITYLDSKLASQCAMQAALPAPNANGDVTLEKGTLPGGAASGPPTPTPTPTPVSVGGGPTSGTPSFAKAAAGALAAQVSSDWTNAAKQAQASSNGVIANDAGNPWFFYCIDSTGNGNQAPCFVPPAAYTMIFGGSFKFWTPYVWVDPTQLYISCVVNSIEPLWSSNVDECDTNPTTNYGYYPVVFRDYFSVTLGYSIFSYTWNLGYWVDAFSTGAFWLGCHQGNGWSC